MKWHNSAAKFCRYRLLMFGWDGLTNLILIAAVLFSSPPAYCDESEQQDYSQFEGLSVIRVEITGNDHTKDYVILREVHTSAGTTFHAQTAAEDVKRLKKISAFSEVEVVPRIEGSDVINEVRVRETAWLIPTVTPSHSEENGWSAGPALSTPNLFGRAASASISTQFGGVTKYAFSVRDPWLRFSPRQLTASVSFTYQEREDKIRESNEITAVTQVRAGFYPDHKRQLSINPGFQYMRTMSDKDSVTLSPANHDHLHRADLMIRFNTIADPLDPRQGWVGGIQELKTGGMLGGDGDSWRTQLDLVRYQPVLKRGAIAIGGLYSHQSGIVGQDLPQYLQYTLGGANSIRGYSQTDLGKVLFGKDQLLATIEYNYELMSPQRIQLFGVSFLSFRVAMSAVAFADYGVAWSDSDDITWDRSKMGYGFGLHALVPEIDRIRLDVGFSEEGEVKFHIAIRSKFEAQRLASR